VWLDLSQSYNQQFKWDKVSVLECLEAWLNDRANAYYKALPCYVLWGLWLTKNNMIFEGKEAQLGRVVHLIRLTFGEGKKPPKLIPQRILQDPVIDFNMPWGFFDGACQGMPGVCGAGAILHLNIVHHFL
jgi:hypothetical protein